MEIKTEKVKVSVTIFESPLQLMIRIASLLIYSKKWVVEKKDIEDSISIRQTESMNFIDIDIKASNLSDGMIEICINSDKVKTDEFDYAVQTIKECVAFLLNKQNEETIKSIVEKTSPEINDLIFIPIEKQLAYVGSELDRLANDSGTYLAIAMLAIRGIIPNIESIESKYWEKIQPFPQYFDSFKDVEDNINLALGLGLDLLDAAKANFVLMTLWLTNEIVKGNIRWDGKAIQNIPTLRPLARQIVELTKKYSARNPQDLDALILQRAALYFLKDLEGLGETDHAIAKLRSLIKAGFIDAQKDLSQDQVKTEQTRNDGKALEEKVKAWLHSMGLRATTTKTSGDGGIDIVAYSESPIFSGKYIVQCKDWAGSVGESVIRDLYGVVMSESANKGILITTGTITKSAQKFAEGKPLELINGQELNKLLQKFKPGENRNANR